MLFYIIIQGIITVAIVGFALWQLKRMADAQEDSARHLVKIAREISEKKSHQPE